MITGAQLFNLFVEKSTTATEVANMDLDTITQHISELRAGPDNINMTDAEIARAILTYAIEESISPEKIY